MKERKKKDSERAGKKRQRMKEAVAARQAAAQPEGPQRDEVDKIKFKPGSGGDKQRQAGSRF